MRIVWILVASLSLLVAGVDRPGAEPVIATRASAAPIPKTAPKREPVGCFLGGEPTCALGNAPKLHVALTNQTAADIYLVGSLDASDCKMRYPHCYFEVIGPGGERVDSWERGCGYMNTLRTDDFVKVPPGGTFDPYQHIDNYGFFSASQLAPRTFQTPGTYRIRFMYSTKSNSIGAWAGNSGRELAAQAEIMGLFRQVPGVEVRSDEFLLTVVAAGE